MQSLDFKFNNQNITGLVDDKGEPWFVALDVIEILGLGNITRAMERLDDDEKLTLPIVKSGQERKTWVTNESGLYHLIFTSTKPEAKAFRKWVTATVLPEIRKTGGFNRHQNIETAVGFQTELRKFKKQMNSASRFVELRIAELAIGKAKPPSPELFDDMEKQWELLMTNVDTAIENFRKQLEFFSKQQK